MAEEQETRIFRLVERAGFHAIDHHGSRQFPVIAVTTTVVYRCEDCGEIMHDEERESKIDLRSDR